MKSIRKVKIVFFMVLILSIAFVNGCVTKAAFQETTKDQDAKLQAVQKIAEANTGKIENLTAESKNELARVDSRVDVAMAKGKDALERAEIAGQLARGKVVYKVMLTSDAGIFSFDKYELSTEHRSILDDLAKMIKSQNKEVFIEIQGHADAIGSEEYNLKLGLKRAEAVRRYFTETHMLPLHLMHTISYGESRPLADNSTKEGRTQNRRVVIVILE